MGSFKHRLEPKELQRLLEAWHDPDVVLRSARYAETELVAELILSTSRELRQDSVAGAERTRARCRDALDAGDLLLVLQRAEQVVGVLRAEVYGAQTTRKVLYISQLNLRREARSSGLGSRVLRVVDDWRCALGVETLALDFMADNPRVAAFYQRLGFHVVGYDLLQKHTPDEASSGARQHSIPNLVRRAQLEDSERITRFLSKRRAFTSFEHPQMASAELAALLQTHRDDAESRLWLAERRGELVGVCAAYPKPGARGRLVIANCFESVDIDVAERLLQTLQDWAREQAALESYVTLWEPCTELLHVALELGFAVGRYKLAKGVAS